MSRAGQECDTTIRFGLFELNPRSGELRRRGVRVNLGDQALCALRALLDRPGEVITREQLRNLLWPDRSYMDFDSALNKAMSEIRTTLGDNGPNPRFVETLRRRGYRFIAPVVNGPMTDRRRLNSIAVLPFENLTGDPEQAHVADGITDAVTTGLGGIRGLRVISRTSAKAFMKGGRSVAAIARDLNVNAVVEGAVVRFSNTTQVNARLVDANVERVLWQRQYNSELKDLLVVCDELTRAVAAEVGGARVQRHPPASPLARAREAYLAYLRGRYFWSRRTEDDMYRAINEFKKAIATDESLALAHSGLADCYSILAVWGFEPSHSAFPVARRAAERAIELDDRLAEAHASLAEVLKDYEWDWSAAESELLRAIALNPNYSTARHSYAQLLVTLTRYPEATEQIEIARVIDPLSLGINAYVPYIYLASRDYDRAVAEGEHVVDLEPNSAIARWQLGRARLFSGDVTGGVAELQTASELARGRPMWRAELGFALARSRDSAGAEAILTDLTVLAQTDHVSPFDLAICHAGLGHVDAALDYLESAYAQRVMRILAIGDPEFDLLRSAPRFALLLDQLKLPAMRFDFTLLRKYSARDV